VYYINMFSTLLLNCFLLLLGSLGYHDGVVDVS
jgi:hypothetical protein